MHFSVVRLRPPYLCCIIELFDSLSVISEQYKLSNVPLPALIFIRSVLVRNPFEIPFFGYKQALLSRKSDFNSVSHSTTKTRSPTKTKIEWKIIKVVYRAPKLCMHIACICLIFETFWSFTSFLTIFMNDFSNQ